MAFTAGSCNLQIESKIGSPLTCGYTDMILNNDGAMDPKSTERSTHDLPPSSCVPCPSIDHLVYGGAA
jgi:hypothetical protein